MVCQDVMKHYSRTSISPRCTVKVDIRKAYDTISWHFLTDVMLGFGFPDKFVDLIRKCISTASFSININGGLVGFFKSNCGIRQGDPMAPYLFALGMEYLSRLLDFKVLHNQFQFHPRCKKANHTHLAFADDIIIFTRGHTSSVTLVKNVLSEFELVSGLQINPTKSNLFICGVSQQDKESLLSILGFRERTLPFRYLGLPIHCKNFRVTDFHEFIGKISSKIQSWAAKSLSYAGRVVLIKSVM